MYFAHINKNTQHPLLTCKENLTLHIHKHTHTHVHLHCEQGERAAICGSAGRSTADTHAIIPDWNQLLYKRNSADFNLRRLHTQTHTLTGVF